MMNHNHLHRRAIEKIAGHPEKFNLGFRSKDIVSVSIEQLLLDNGRSVAEPDVVFELRNHEVHVIEYKGKGNGELLARAKKQLEQTASWYGRYRSDIPLGNIYTHIISGDDPKYKDLLRGM